jgi:hypothetical protein
MKFPLRHKPSTKIATLTKTRVGDLPDKQTET